MRKILGIISIFNFFVIGYLIFVWAPIESAMGITQKIMYIHVPSVMTAFIAFFITFLFSIVYLWKRNEKFDIVAYSSAEIGLLFCGITLMSGSIWGKPTWNTYWTWDARLTTTLILFIIYAGYILLRKFTEYGEQQARFAAVIGIIGFIDVPLIHQSVKWWRTLHQPSTMFSKKANVIDQPLFIVLIVSICIFLIYYAFLLITRVEFEQKHRQYLKQISNI
jgi:heme exporter protein C